MVEYGLLARGEDYRLSREAMLLRSQLAKAWSVAENQDTGDQKSKPVELEMKES